MNQQIRTSSPIKTATQYFILAHHLLWHCLTNTQHVKGMLSVWMVWARVEQDVEKRLTANKVNCTGMSELGWAEIEINPVHTDRLGSCVGPLMQSYSFMGQSLLVTLSVFQGTKVCCRNKLLGQHPSFTTVKASCTTQNHNIVWLFMSEGRTEQKGWAITATSSLDAQRSKWTTIIVQIYIHFIYFNISWS